MGFQPMKCSLNDWRLKGGLRWSEDSCDQNCNNSISVNIDHLRIDLEGIFCNSLSVSGFGLQNVYKLFWNEIGINGLEMIEHLPLIISTYIVFLAVNLNSSQSGLLAD